MVDTLAVKIPWSTVLKVATSASMQPLSQVATQHVFPDDWMVYHSRRPQKIAASQILDHYPQFHNIK
jgi:hypothetical protein